MPGHRCHGGRSSRTHRTPPGHAGHRPAARVLAAAASLLVLALLSGCGAAGADRAKTGLAGRDSYRIGVLQIAADRVLDQTVAAFQSRIRELVRPKTVTFDLQNAQGDQNLISATARDLAGSDNDAFAVIGTPAVIALAQLVRDRPIIALAMGDPVGSKVAASLDAPGGNVTGSIDFVDPKIVLDQIMTIEPAPARLGTVYDPSNQNMRIWVDALRKAVRARPGLSLTESTITGPGDVPTGIRGLIGRADAVLIGPDATVFAGQVAVGATAARSRVPVYLCGGDATTNGILASVGPDYPTVGRLAADAAAKVLKGTAPGAVPFARPGGVGFHINKKTRDTLKVNVPQQILSSAVVQ